MASTSGVSLKGQSWVFGNHPHNTPITAPFKVTVTGTCYNSPSFMSLKLANIGKESQFHRVPTAAAVASKLQLASLSTGSYIHRNCYRMS